MGACASGMPFDESGNPCGPTVSASPTSISGMGEPLYTVDYSNTASMMPIPDASSLPLPGQLPGLPGGGASNGTNIMSDPSGMNAIHLDPTVNPTPTGGYMSALDSVLKAASTGFSTYVKGSPSVAIPPPKKPTAGIFSSVLSGTTNWMVIGIVVVAGLALMGVLAVKA